MKRIAYIFAMLLMMSTFSYADETITVSANSTDISESLDLKAVAKLFARAKNLEEFETLLNNPDSAFTNLDLNGDGLIDYLRVVETGSGNQRLIVLQAVLAKDIYQDVASIYVERDEANNSVSVQVIGDEYIYGQNYVIEPVYIYRPVIYDWFWGPDWYCWHSPYYWGYYPHWWYAHTCWDPYWYWDHCCHFHHHYAYCSFRYAAAPRPAYHMMPKHEVSRHDYAVAHPDRGFSTRNVERQYVNARDVERVAASTRVTSEGRSMRAAGTSSVRGESSRTSMASSAQSRTFGSQNIAATRQASTTSRQQASTTGRQQVATTSRQQASTATRQQVATTSRQQVATTTRQQASTTARQQVTTAPSTRQQTVASSSRASSSSYSAPSRSSYSGGSSFSGSSSRSSYSGGGSYSGGSSRSSYSGGSSFSGGGSSSRGGGGGGRR